MRSSEPAGVASLVVLLTIACAVGDARSAASAENQESPPPTYASVRGEVTVETRPIPSSHRPRPENFFQLAGSVNPTLCGEVLEAFNEPGRYSGDDRTRWLLDNSHQIAFESLNPPGVSGTERLPGTEYAFPDLEHARVDIDSSGDDEHVYRLNSVVSSVWSQRLMIVPVDLQQHPELLARYADECKKFELHGDCTSTRTLIRYALTAPVPDRLADEWAFTKANVWLWSTRDDVSRKLIQGGGGPRRNVGSASGAYWSLYRVASAVVAVGAPVLGFAPPELLVFSPDQQRRGVLQCVIVPVAWHE